MYDQYYNLEEFLQIQRNTIYSVKRDKERKSALLYSRKIEVRMIQKVQPWLSLLKLFKCLQGTLVLIFVNLQRSIRQTPQYRNHFFIPLNS